MIPSWPLGEGSRVYAAGLARSIPVHPGNLAASGQRDGRAPQGAGRPILRRFEGDGSHHRSAPRRPAGVGERSPPGADSAPRAGPDARRRRRTFARPARTIAAPRSPASVDVGKLAPVAIACVLSRIGAHPHPAAAAALQREPSHVGRRPAAAALDGRARSSCLGGVDRKQTHAGRIALPGQAYAQRVAVADPRHARPLLASAGVRLARLAAAARQNADDRHGAQRQRSALPAVTAT